MASIVPNDFVVLLILTIINILAIVYTWKIGSVFNTKSWNFIIGAFILLLVNRVISFLDVFGIVPYEGAIALLDSVYIQMIFLVLIIIGMMRIYYNVVSSMEMERTINRVSKKKKHSKKSRSSWVF